MRSTAFTLAMTVAAAASAAEGDVNRGGELANLLCAECHAAGRDDASPRADAPPLRDFAARWPLEYLEEALAEGIVVSHRDVGMPEFELEPDEIGDLLSYIESISP